MTNKEAIRRILDHKRVHSLNEPRAILINEALDLAIKALEESKQGEWVRKEDVIHSIAKQYSEHNELVPIWLSIGDIKGGEE